MTTGTYLCERHETEVQRGQPCPHCMAEYETLPAPENMTGDERAAEVEQRIGVLTIPYGMMMDRLVSLVGRDIYTHELGFNRDGLIEEARGTKAHPDFLDEITSCLPKTVQVIEIDVDELDPKASEN